MISRMVNYREAPPRRGRIEGWVLVVALLLGLLLTACGDESLGPVCTAQAVFGINLRVTDGAGTPLAQSALGVAVDGAYTDTLIVISDMDLAGAVERPGTYDVAVFHPGFATWSADAVVVTADACHVIPVALDVSLTPNP